MTRVQLDPKKLATIQASLETDALSGQLARQRGTLDFYGVEEPEQAGPSFLGRVFDILGRPLNAVAEATRGVVDAFSDTEEEEIDPLQARTYKLLIENGRHEEAEAMKHLAYRKVENNQDFLSRLGQGVSEIPGGLVGGLVGDDRTFFSDVLDEAGMESGIPRAVLGFAGDVLFDPLTYVTFGVGKAATGLEAASRASKAAVAAASSPAAKKLAAEAMDIAERRFLDDLVLNKTKLNLPDLIANNAKAAKEAETAYSLSVFKKTEQEWLLAHPGTFKTKFMGRQIASSEGIYRLVSNATEPLRQTKFAQAINVAFRPKAMFPDKVNLFKRLKEGQSLSEFDAVMADFRQLLGRITHEEGEHILRAMEEGIDLTGSMSKHGLDLGEVQKFMRDEWDEEFDEMMALGVVKPELDALDQLVPRNQHSKYRENYVPHYYANTIDEVTKALSNTKKVRVLSGTKSELSYAKARRFATMKDAEAAGLKPLTDLREVFAKRVSEQYRYRGRVKFEVMTVAEYGIPLKGLDKSAKGFTRELESQGFKAIKIENGNRYLVPDIVARAFKEVKEIYENEAASHAFLEFYDKALLPLKVGMTIINPGHHMRNAMGDIFLNYLDNVRDPRRYKQSMDVIMSARNGFKDKNTLLKLGGQNVTASNVWLEYLNSGQKAGFYQTEFKSLQSRALAPFKNFAEKREDWTRLAHFIDATDKYLIADPKLTLRQAAEKAGPDVAKYNIDYGDFTNFETKVMKRVIPFYSFLRKNMPIQLETMALNPSKVTHLSAAQRAIGEALGSDESVKRIEDQIPEWLRQLNPIYVAGGNEPIAITPGLPIQDLNRLSDLATGIANTVTGQGDPVSNLAGGVSGLFNQLIAESSPILQLPFEATTNRQLGSGIPIESGLDYATSYVPALRLVSNTLDNEKRTSLKVTDWVNYLTGIGIQVVTEERQQGELRRQQDLLNKLIREFREGAEQEISPPATFR